MLAESDTIYMLGLLSTPLSLFRESPAGALTPDAMAILHITDVHADPFYDVSQYLCGNKGSTRNLTLQDAKGKPTKDLCSVGGAPVEGQCSPWAGSHEHMRDYWEHTIRPGKLCPCGVVSSRHSELGCRGAGRVELQSCRAAELQSCKALQSYLGPAALHS